MAVYSGSLSLTPLMDGDMSRVIIHGSSRLLATLGKWYALQAKYGEKLGIGAEYTASSESVIDDSLEEIIDKTRTSLAWQLGHHAQGLVRVSPKDDKKDKPDDDADEQKKKAFKAEKERKQALNNAMQSNLLSGGIDYAHIRILKQETKDQLRKYAALAEDKQRHKYPYAGLGGANG